MLESSLKRKNEQLWLLDAYAKTKLRTFIQFYVRESARNIVNSNLDRTLRSVLTKLKIGVLRLQIEMGRWKDTLLEYRSCRVCDSPLLENETHFLLQCDGLITERSTLHRELMEKHDYEIAGGEIDQMKSMLEKKCIRTTAKHVNIMYECRREILYEKMKIDESENNQEYDNNTERESSS